MSTPKAGKGLSSEVRFGEPPPPRTRKYDWNAIAERLRQHPGEWAEVFKDDRYSLVTSVSTGGVVALRASQGFRYRTTNNHVVDGRRHCALWLMYDPKYDQTIKKGRKS